MEAGAVLQLYVRMYTVFIVCSFNTTTQHEHAREDATNRSASRVISRLELAQPALDLAHQLADTSFACCAA